MIFQARKFGFMEGWMASVNTVDLPKDFPFKSDDQVLLPENPTVETQVERQVSNDKEEGSESLESRELSKQINSHVVVLDDDNPRANTTVLSPDAMQPIVTLDPSSTNPPASQKAFALTPPTTNTPGV